MVEECLLRAPPGRQDDWVRDLRGGVCCGWKWKQKWSTSCPKKKSGYLSVRSGRGKTPAGPKTKKAVEIYSRPLQPAWPLTVLLYPIILWALWRQQKP
ncbi:hypothetical protein BDW71DRAFT_171434 [Aspergillus fruticulosus]